MFFIATLLMSFALCRLLIAIAPKDAPDGDRKAQKFAVPTSGGLAIAAAAGAVYVAELILVPAFSSTATLPELTNLHAQFLATSQLLPHILLALFVLIFGAIDDAHTLPTSQKLIILSIGCLLTTFTGLTAEKVFIPIVDATLPLAVLMSVFGSALWLFVMMNATNFMDGSNGLSLGSIAIMLTALAISYLGNPAVGLSPETVTVWSGLAFVTLLLIGAICGFLFWNLQGQLYAGDAGALFCGTVFASFSLIAAQNGNIWFPATLALPFLIDVFATLIWRALNDQNLLQPHRDHAYQLLRRSGSSHLQTALIWWLLTLICAMGGLWAFRLSTSTSFWVFAGLFCFLLTLWILQRAHWTASQEAASNTA